MIGRTSATVSLLVAVAALLPAAAHAAPQTYCVGTSAAGCVPQATLPDALAAADANGADHDTVRLGLGTHTGGTAADPHGVDVIGAGPGTIITKPGGDLVTVLELASTVQGTSSLSHASVLVPAGSTTRGLKIGRGSVSDATVTGTAGATNAAGIQMIAAGTLTVSNVAVALQGAGSHAVESLAGDLVIRNSTLVAPTGVVGSATESTTVSGVSTSGNVGIRGTGAHVAAENSLLLLTGNNARGLVVEGKPNAQPFDGKTDARNLTIVGNGSPGSVGVDVVGDSGVSPDETADATVSSTVIRGTSISLRRKAQAGDSAKLTVIYSLFGAAIDESGAGGPADAGLGKVPGNPDPLFASPASGDFTPLAGSPLVNAADPRPLLPGESTVDITGRPREALGRRDIGAFELQTLPPPPDKTRPRLRILTKSARLTRKGELKVRISCPKVETEGCVGTATANSAKKLRLKKRAKKRTLRLGSRRFSMAAGKSKVVVIKVSKAARKEIAKRRKLSVRLSVAATDAAGNIGRVSRVMTVRPPKKPAKKKR